MEEVKILRVGCAQNDIKKRKATMGAFLFISVCDLPAEPRLYAIGEMTILPRA